MNKLSEVVVIELLAAEVERLHGVNASMSAQIAAMKHDHSEALKNMATRLRDSEKRWLAAELEGMTAERVQQSLMGRLTRIGTHHQVWRNAPNTPDMNTYLDVELIKALKP